MADGRHYEVLCVANFSTPEEVRVAYRSLALKYHPDKNLDDPTAVERFRAVSRAYEVLSNEETKQRYDLALRAALSSSGPHTSGVAVGQGGTNPYAMKPPSMSDIYRELYQRQAARASTRNRTSSAPPQSTHESSSQYTKEQQEHFRKQERARQQELRRQREKERKEQRDRERRALRKEQERQKELNQQRWCQHQQQQVYPPRASTRTTSASDSVIYASGSSSASPRVRRGASRTYTTERSSSNRKVCASKAAVPGTPVRLTSVRSGVSTPRTPRAVWFSTAAAKAAASPGCAEVGASGSPSPSFACREGESADPEGVRGYSSGRCYTPLATPPGNDTSLDEGLDRTSNHGSHACSTVRAEGPEEAYSTRVPHSSHTASASLSQPVSVLSGAGGAEAQQTKPTQPSADATHTVSDERSGEETLTGRGGTRQSPSSSHRLATRSRTVNGRGPVLPSSTSATTPRRWFTPRSFTGSHTTGATASLSSTAPSPRRRSSTPRVATLSQATRNGRSPSSSAGATMTRARASNSLNKNSSLNNGGSSGSGPGHAPAIRKASSTPNLTDAEMLAKKRREALEKEKERQRAARLTEEGRQLRRLARAASAATKKSAEKPPSFEEQLMYLIQDETSERDQLIEREEELARRRLHRQHTAVTLPVVLRHSLSALMTEEKLRRNGLLQVCRIERSWYYLFFDERLDRLYVEGREGRDWRQIAEREAAGAYHVQRVCQRRAPVLTKETSHSHRLFGSSHQTLRSGQGMSATGARHPMLASAAGTIARYHINSPINDDAAQFEELCDLGVQHSRNHPQFYRQPPPPAQQQQQQQQQPDECSSPFSRSRTSATAAAISIGTLGSRRDGASDSDSVGFPVTKSMSSSAHPVSSLSVATRLPGRDASPKVSMRASLCALPELYDYFASSALTDRTVFSATTSTNGEAKMSVVVAERHALALFSEEAHRRSALVTQQHQEEMSLRRRRAAALHRVFAKDKESAVKHAQRCALMDVAALKAQLRILQRKVGDHSSPHDFESDSKPLPHVATSPQRPETPFAGASAVTESSANSISSDVDALTASNHRSSLSPQPRLTAKGAGEACSPSSISVGPFSPVNTATTAVAGRSGWTALLDSDIEG
ncbi:hypothetical protein JKF63_06622 [Porcisia hertigi]|uniref:J domain-containing protein n=1 Tax=Porcisia hertigi TaxID=2761500 RepID=A0A836IY56_9TRYP|nr:hypothetical protein JKF63_06622 [Porcisia hertigi]